MPDWQGAGYVINDMDTGAGAWKIGGGLNGGYLSGLFLGVALDILILSLTVSVVAGPIGIALLAPLLAAIAVFAGIYFTILSTMIWDEDTRQCFIGGLVTGVSATLIMLNFPTLFGRILSALGLAASQAGMAGSGARACWN